MSVQSEKAENKQKEAKIEKLTDRLRKMSQDPKFTNEDREEIARQIKKLKSKVPGGSDTLKKKPKKSIRKGGGPDFMVTEDMLVGFNKGGAVKRYKGGLMVKPKRAKGGY